MLPLPRGCLALAAAAPTTRHPALARSNCRATMATAAPRAPTLCCLPPPTLRSERLGPPAERWFTLWLPAGGSPLSMVACGLACRRITPQGLLVCALKTRNCCRLHSLRRFATYVNFEGRPQSTKVSCGGGRRHLLSALLALPGCTTPATRSLTPPAMPAPSAHVGSQLALLTLPSPLLPLAPCRRQWPA